MIILLKTYQKVITEMLLPTNKLLEQCQAYSANVQGCTMFSIIISVVFIFYIPDHMHAHIGTQQWKLSIKDVGV